MEEKTQVAEARATLSYARISARKVKIVADLMRGKSVEEALNPHKMSASESNRVRWKNKKGNNSNCRVKAVE